MRMANQTIHFEEGGEYMKYYIIDYRTLDGEHEYIEHGVLASRTYNNTFMVGRNFVVLIIFKRYP